MTYDIDTDRPGGGEFYYRWGRVQELMAERGMDGALFMQNADLLYLCGTTQAEAVFLPSRGEGLVMSKRLVDRVQAEAPWTRVHDLPPRGAWGDFLRERFGPSFRTVGLELDVLPASTFLRLSRGPLAGFEVVDAAPVLRQARSIKTEYEIRMMKEAAAALDAVVSRTPELLSQGDSELTLEGRLAGALRAGGHQGLVRGRHLNQEMFLGHVLSGENGLVRAKIASPTGGTGVGPGFGQGASDRPIGPDELISIDLVGAHMGYLADQTRIFFTGSPPAQVRKTYDRLLGLMDDLEDYIRPGVTAGDVYDKAFQLADAYLILDGFMGLDESRCPFIGHGVGIELDERPVLARRSPTALAAGNTIAVEPRVFLPGIGVVGVEDTYHLTSDGPQRLTRGARELIEIHF